jgi:hypothetical protein
VLYFRKIGTQKVVTEKKFQTVKGRNKRCEKVIQQSEYDAELGWWKDDENNV